MFCKVNKIFLVLGVLLFSLVFSGCTPNKNQGVGTITDLDDAYRLGILSHDDLLKIAEYHNNNKEYAGSINQNTEIKIKTAYLKELSDNSKTIDDVDIMKYYGVYNNCYVIMLTNNFSDCLPVERIVSIAGVEFHYPNGNYIVVWTLAEISDEENLKLAYLKKYLLKDYPSATINDVKIEKDLGKYNGAHITIINNSYVDHLSIMTKETILNFVFKYPNKNSALVFFQNSFYTLKEAYKEKILTIASLEELIKKFPVPSGDEMEINGEPII